MALWTGWKSLFIVYVLLGNRVQLLQEINGSPGVDPPFFVARYLVRIKQRYGEPR